MTRMIETREVCKECGGKGEVTKAYVPTGEDTGPPWHERKMAPAIGPCHHCKGEGKVRGPDFELEGCPGCGGSDADIHAHEFGVTLNCGTKGCGWGYFLSYDELPDFDQSVEDDMPAIDTPGLLPLLEAWNQRASTAAGINGEMLEMLKVERTRNYTAYGASQHTKELQALIAKAEQAPVASGDELLTSVKYLVAQLDEGETLEPMSMMHIGLRDDLIKAEGKMPASTDELAEEYSTLSEQCLALSKRMKVLEAFVREVDAIDLTTDCDMPLSEDWLLAEVIEKKERAHELIGVDREVTG